MPDNILSGIESSSCTQFKVIEFSHEWTIQNFSFCNKKTGECFQSAQFSADGANNNSKWCLILYPNGDTEESKEYLSLYLSLKSCHRKSVTVKFNFSIWSAKLKKFGSSTRWSPLQQFEVGTRKVDFGYNKVYRRDLILNAEKGFLSDDDTLIIRCEIRESLEAVSISSGTNNELFDFESGLANDFELLFSQKKFYDVTLSVGDREFSAHKTILAARSPVFAAMFEHNMMEQRQSKVTITDIAPSVVNEMLTFMYTDKSPNLENMAEDLLAVADKYSLSKLRKMCENVLCAKITTENMTDMLTLADLHQAEMLKTRAINLINVRATKLMNTPSWKNMLSENSDLVHEAYLSIERPRAD